MTSDIQTCRTPTTTGDRQIKYILLHIKVEEPAKRKSGIKVPDAKTLVEKLKNEAKVIS